MECREEGRKDNHDGGRREMQLLCILSKTLCCRQLRYRKEKCGGTCVFATSFFFRFHRSVILKYEVAPLYPPESDDRPRLNRITANQTT